MPRLTAENLIGRSFGLWTVVSALDHRRYCLCRCRCGTEKWVYSYSLISNLSKSCGCGTRLNLLSQRFGRWLVVGSGPDRGYKVCWKVRCDCGHERIVQGNTLLEGRSRSCGCLKDEVARHTKRVHGMARSREYNSWQTAKERCHNPKATGYKNYGGRGIRVCDRWRQSFANFFADMGPRPKGTSIDRIDNNGNYEPANCRWATKEQQSKNQRRVPRKRRAPMLF